jgi:hypothetical protein
VNFCELVFGALRPRVRVNCPKKHRLGDASGHALLTSARFTLKSMAGRNLLRAKKDLLLARQKKSRLFAQKPTKSSGLVKGTSWPC